MENCKHCTLIWKIQHSKLANRPFIFVFFSIKHDDFTQKKHGPNPPIPCLFLHGSVLREVRGLRPLHPLRLAAAARGVEDALVADPAAHHEGRRSGVITWPQKMGIGAIYKKKKEYGWSYRPLKYIYMSIYL